MLVGQVRGLAQIGNIKRQSITSMTLLSWLKENVWLCTYIMLGIALLTFLLNFVIKKHTSEKSQSIKNVKESSVNQGGRDVTIKQ